MRLYTKLVLTVLFGAVFLCSAPVIIENLSDFKLIYKGWSARYGDSFDSSERLRIKRSAANQDMNGLWQVFWSEKSEEVKGDSKNIETLCLFYDGDCSLIWNVSFISGGYPGEENDNHCAVSAELSWLLWGSTDTLGKEIEIGKRRLTVSGIYDGEEPTAIIAGDASSELGNIDWVLKEPVIRETLIGYIETLGIGKPDSIVDGEGMGMLMTFLSSIPIIAAGAITAATTVSALMKYVPGTWKKWIFIGVILILSMFLPVLLSKLPGWILPSKWSDFSFWSSLMGDFTGYMKEWFGLKPTAKDIYAKQLMLKQVILVTVSLTSLGLFYHFANIGIVKNK